MKITFIGSVMDYANVLTEYAHLLNKHSDIECKVVCHQPHPLNYKKKHDYDLCNTINDQDRSKLTQFIEESEFVIFGEENTWNYENYHALEIIKNFLGIDLINSSKKLCIWHAGTVYRNNHAFYNNHPLRDKLYKSLYAIDLYRLSPKLDQDKPLYPYQYLDFNYEKFISKFEDKIKNKPWKILHCPSDPQTKGSNLINEVINKLNLSSSRFLYENISGRPHHEIVEEKSKSIFYIDQFNPSVGGYGIAALESLFNQNLTFSTVNNIGDSIDKLTGKHETPIIHLGKTKEQMYNCLEKNIKNITETDMIKHVKSSGEWIKKYYNTYAMIEGFKNL